MVDNRPTHTTASGPRPTREECIRRAGRTLAIAYRELETLPIEEAAARAYTPTGPSLEELKARIAAARAATPTPTAKAS